ncbi:hypothetical protein ACQ858_05620 [Variovorax ureilyticus]
MGGHLGKAGRAATFAQRERRLDERAPRASLLIGAAFAVGGITQLRA